MTNGTFISFPVLTTERLTLRQLTSGDGQDILALRSDPEINKYLDRQPANSLEDAIQFINKINSHIENGNALYWAVTFTSSNTFAGTICLFDFSTEKSSCEIGYELMTTFQGQGIMQEAAQAVISFVFRELPFQQILACTHRGNQSSAKLLAKLNFVKSGNPAEENPDLDIYALTA